MQPFNPGPLRTFGLIVSFATAGVLALPCSAQSSAASALAALRPKALRRRVAANADFTTRVQLSGHLPGWARAENESAKSVDLSATIPVTVVLRRDAATETAFENLLAAQQDPDSPLYHQWLTPAQVGSMFGVAPADLQAVESWLESEGLRVDRVEPNGVMVDVSGSVAAVSSAFRTNFAQFNVGGETRLSATEEPSVPAALETVIAGVHGLSESSLHPQSRDVAVQGRLTTDAKSGRPMLNATDGSHFVAPNDFATIYDLTPLYEAGNKGATIAGKTQRVAILGRSRVAATDISEFESIAGLPSAQPNAIIPTGGTDPGITGNGDQDEATLDVDRVMGTAPGVGVDLVVSADSRTVSGIYTAAEYEVNTLRDPIMSISFGDCEANEGAQGVSAWDSIFSAAAAEGISVMVSSGDSGAAGCDGDSKTLPAIQKASINYICSSSYATCVGGTEFADTTDANEYWSSTNGTGDASAESYIPEGAWNEPTSGSSYVASGTGGGTSQYVSKPSWQTGEGVPADGRRDVPDVALNSALHDGYFACLAYAGGDCSKSTFEIFGGTSAAAPGMAGIVALMNTAVGSSAGDVNPLLYRLAAGSGAVFHDVTVASSGVSGCTLTVPSMCNNSTPSATGLTGGLAGYEVGAGFDESTGLGSVDANRLVTAAASGAGSGSGSGGSAGSFSLASSPGSLTLSDGAASGNTVTITAATANGFSGTVGLTCSVALAGGGLAAVLPTCTMSPGSVVLTASGAGSTASAVVAIGSKTTTSTCVTTGGGSSVRTAGLALAGVCLLLLPFSRRRGLRFLLMLCVMAVGAGAMTGCGGTTGSSIAHNCTVETSAGTTTGTYVVTVSGTSGGTRASTSFSATLE
ncbi:MAG TPA: S53 family peptidase [Acidobacteriaceae bacterium]|nr:S53 family peptidase [Acidobacteriaceae bacterium]